LSETAPDLTAAGRVEADMPASMLDPCVGNTSARERLFVPDGLDRGWARRLFETAKQPFWALSWTWALARVLKPDNDKRRRSAVIKRWNIRYLILSVALFATAVAVSRNDLARLRPAGFAWWAALIQYVLLWRFFEVLRAFYEDAIDKLADREPTSDVSPAERVGLALRSYLELVIDFALVYALMPKSAWVANTVTDAPASVTDALWYSANVITTSGGGDYAPSSTVLKFMTLGELVCGVVLLVVCFTIYASQALGGRSASANCTGATESASSRSPPRAET
jgi:hypothetical protein